MHDVVDDVGRRGVGGGTRGLGAAALIDGDVNDDGAGLHRFDGSGADQLGAAAPGMSTDAMEVGAPAQGDRVGGREHGAPRPPSSWRSAAALPGCGR